MIKSKKIYIVGAGYVGFSTGVALANLYNVILIDRDQVKVEKINHGISPIAEEALADALIKNQDKITAFKDLSIIEDGSLVFVAVPTDYEEAMGRFNTKILDAVLEEIVTSRPNCRIVIKSTIPIGFTTERRALFSSKNIFFSPEFLREGRAYRDVTNPERIIVSPNSSEAQEILSLLVSISLVAENNYFCTDSTTAEAIKLFSNTYLAMRVAFFNEVDTYAIAKELNSEDLIKGMSYDSRIGMFYNNPSFGFGGYCFPKDTKQTEKEAAGLPMALPTAIVKSNELRLRFLAADIQKVSSGKVIGMYGLAMKTGSDNMRTSSSTILLTQLVENGLKVLVYEPLLDGYDFFDDGGDIEVIDDFESFRSKVDLVITNRPDERLKTSGLEIYSRDIFNEN